ncbi:MAG: C-GCAxxG-C-C family (seleno)protein [Bacillota bacterium]
MSGKSVFDDLHAQETRKALTLALMRAAYAYMGLHKGYENVSDCVKDEEIRRTSALALEEAGGALVSEYHFSKDEMKNWTQEAVRNFKQSFEQGKIENLATGISEILKNGLTGAILLCKNNGVWPYYSAKILAYALAFESTSDPDSVMIREYTQYYGVKESAKKFCELENEPELLQLIARQYEDILSGKAEDVIKTGLMKKAFALGFNNEKVYRGCAQCTLLSMFELFGRENSVLFQSASALSGGMAQTGDGACGGYTGGILYTGSVIGRRLDRMKIDKDRQAQLASYKMAQLLRDRFIETYGSVICADIHREIFGKAYCLRTQAVKKEFDDAGAHTVKCTTVIGTASAWIAEILYDNGYNE